MTTLITLLRDGLAVALLVAGGAKLSSPANAGVAGCRLVRADWCARRATVVGRVLGSAEVAVGALALAGIVRAAVAVVLVVLTSGFFTVSVYGVMRLRDVDCGCFGALARSGYSLRMVARNALLLVAATAVLAEPRFSGGASAVDALLLVAAAIAVAVVATAASDSADALRELERGYK